MNRSKTMAIALVAALPLVFAHADPEAGAEATKTGFGIMKALTQEVVDDTPETTSGRTRTAVEVKVVEQTSRIPARLGIRFGFTYSVTNLPAGAQVVWKKTVKHPPIRKPDGSTSRGFTFLERHVTSPAGTIQTFTGYGFDHAYELASGEWTVELWYGKQRLLGHTFEVYDPEKESSQPESGRVRK